MASPIVKETLGDLKLCAENERKAFSITNEKSLIYKTSTRANDGKPDATKKSYFLMIFNVKCNCIIHSYFRKSTV